MAKWKVWNKVRSKWFESVLVSGLIAAAFSSCMASVQNTQNMHSARDMQLQDRKMDLHDQLILAMAEKVKGLAFYGYTLYAPSSAEELSSAFYASMWKADFIENPKAYKALIVFNDKHDEFVEEINNKRGKLQPQKLLELSIKRSGDLQNYVQCYIDAIMEEFDISSSGESGGKCPIQEV